MSKKVLVCNVFDVTRSAYYSYKRKKAVIDAVRLDLKARVNTIFKESRSSADSRTITEMLQTEGIEIGRYKVRKLMPESGLICKQPWNMYPRRSTDRPCLRLSVCVRRTYLAN
ncbi:IS3 family transposase [Pontibacterium sp.]|uniref:IS3 family transposase n=1 Tax=Pontibacterium sp. TaxID=2036026 RepID=UPI003561F6D2